MKNFFFVVLLFCCFNFFGQGNCLLYPEGSNERKACRLAETTGELKQGSRASQERFDSIIALNPNYAWAYFEKSVAYLKRGLLIDGLNLLNKAVELDPASHLCYRAYWYFQNRNYKLCVEDLERYYAIPNAFIYELTPGGDRDMRILLGLSYAKLGAIEKGIATIEACINSYKTEASIGFTDYHCLGMLHVQNKAYKEALDVFNKQLEITEDFPESYYFMAMAYKGLAMPEQEKLFLQKALDKFQDTNHMPNYYLCYRIYPEDVKNSLKL